MTSGSTTVRAVHAPTDSIEHWRSGRPSQYCCAIATITSFGGGEVANEFITVVDAATRLGVSQQRVRILLANGALCGRRVGSMWLVDSASVAAHAHTRQPDAGRPLAPVTAWAALITNFAEQLDPEVVNAFGIVGQRRARVRALQSRDVDSWRWIARRRATVNRYATRPAYIDRIRNEAGITPAGLCADIEHGISTNTESVDVYVDRTTAHELVRRYRLRPDLAGNVTIRAIELDDPDQLAAVQDRPLPPLVVFIDLIEDRDWRTSASGRAQLAKHAQRTAR